MVLTPDGQFVAQNPTAAQLLTNTHGRPSRLNEAFSNAYCLERTRLMRDVLERREPRSVVEIVRGSFRTSTFAPVTIDRGQPAILWSSEPGAAEGVARAMQDDLGVLESLTNRELEVLALLGSGLSNPQMAKAMGRSIRTVHWHCAALCEKLNMSRPELARLAVKHGLVPSRNHATAAAH